MKVKIGQKASKKKIVTQEDIDMYAQITGDYNPLHFDVEFAKKTKFGRLVAQGGITSGLLNALVAMEMPGPGTVFLDQHLQYKAPVFIGDSLIAEAEIIKMHPSKPVTTLSVNIKNQNDMIVLEGECVCYTFDVEL